MTLIVKFENQKQVQGKLLELAKGNSLVAEDAAISIILKAEKFAKEHALDPSRPPKAITRRYVNSIHSLINRRGGGNSEVVSDAEMKRRECENILAALRQTGWRIRGPGGAAELLDIKSTTLASRIKKLGLKRPQ